VEGGGRVVERMSCKKVEGQKFPGPKSGCILYAFDHLSALFNSFPRLKGFTKKINKKKDFDST
jgi:hypothetical protein